MKNRSNNKYQLTAEHFSVYKSVAPKQGINNKRDLRASGLSLLPLALRPLLFLVAFLSISFILQNSYTKSVSAASITLTIPNGISLSIKPEDKATFNKSDSSTLSVKSDANFGYTLSIKAKDSTNSNNLVNGSNKLTSISSPMSEADFNSSAENNAWGYMPSKLNSTDNADFQPGPTTSDSTLDKTASPNASKNNDYKITLAAKVDSTIPTGAYKNTFVLTASANTVSYSITYNLNEGSWTDKSPQTGLTTETSVKISSIIPTRNGYEFQGWCSAPASNDTCDNGTIYHAGETYNLNTENNDLNLWAMWTRKLVYGDTCSTDGKVLGDGRCWSPDICPSSTVNYEYDVAAKMCPADLHPAILDDYVNVVNVYFDTDQYLIGAGYQTLGILADSIFTKDWSGNMPGMYQTWGYVNGELEMARLGFHDLSVAPVNPSVYTNIDIDSIPYPIAASCVLPFRCVSD